jgi:hypothetical protein
MANRIRELARLNLGIDSKLRGCDLVKLKVRHVCRGEQIASRAIVMPQKTQRPVQFEITQPTASVRQDPAGVRRRLGLDTPAYGTHSIRRTRRR